MNDIYEILKLRSFSGKEHLNERVPKIMSDKRPVRIYLQEETIDLLIKAAKEHTNDLMSYNEVAALIITRCLPLWIDAHIDFDNQLEEEVAKLKKTRRSVR